MKTMYLILSLLVFPVLVIAQEIGDIAVVAPVKMNVLYRGIQNPIEIAVPGVTSDRVTATLTNGTIKKTAGGWEVSPGEQNESVVTVLVNNRKISERTFRIKNIPEPVAVFAGIYDGHISKDAALKNDVIEVELANFDWDLKFTVKSFILLCSDGKSDFEESSETNKITGKMKSLISGCKIGQNIVFKDIIAIGPDGRSRNLNPIVLTLK
jgi:gliding motility-associated protein GldM